MTQQQELDAAVSVVPTTLMGLLAEEWTINPYSTLPSFLEMIFMEQADAQARKALVSAMEALQHTLTRRRDRLLRQRQHQQARHSSDASSSILDRIFTSSIQRLQLAIQDVEYRLVRLLEHLMRDGSAEVATLAYYLMQRHSLASSAVSATISEAMYGGRRVKVAKLSTSDPPGADDQNPSQPQKASLQSLTRTDQTRLALLLALGPLIETKLNTLHQHWKQQHQQPPRQFGSGNVREPVDSWKRRLFLILYPLARASVHGANWICQWRFLIGHSVFFNLPSVLLQQVVRRVTQQDKEDPASSSLKSSSLPKGGTNELPAASPETAPAPVVKNLGAPRDDDHGGTKQMVKSVVVVAAGALVVSWLTQMRAAYQQHQQERLLLATRNATTFNSSATNHNTTPQQSQDSNNHHDSCRLDSIPPAPPPPPSRWTANMTPSFLDQCPLCQARPRVQPAASSSGFVFCYKCILAYVRRHSACPMTKQPCSESRIVRLYEPHS